MPVDIIAGAAPLGTRPPYETDESVSKFLDILKKHNVTHVDSAQVYGNSEAVLGRVHAGDSFTIDTKWGDMKGFTNPGTVWATADFISTTAEKSIERLAVPQVDVFYLHFPDKATPIATTVDAIDAVYRKGLFRRFGLSNFDAAAVQEVYDYAKANGRVLPTVYQGQYNPIYRQDETLLFPTLRKLGIAYRAYSPLAGGLLTKTAEDFHSGKGRFNEGGLYHSIYNKPGYINSLAAWADAAAAEGVSGGELSYRWVAWHSTLSDANGDGLIIGAREHAQLEETLSWIAKGPLSNTAVAAIEKVWEGVSAVLAEE